MIQFDIRPFKNIIWSTTKRLLYGSLICLSPDNFDTFLFDIVTDRTPANLENGQIHVLFENNGNMEVKSNITYMMAETTAYFEAYRHVLEGLHEVKESMPLQRYIVHCETEINPPNYLLASGEPMYDFTPILSEEAVCQRLRKFPVLKTNRWPNERHLSFDPSQMKAAQMALTKELALIQGS